MIIKKGQHLSNVMIGALKDQAVLILHLEKKEVLIQEDVLYTKIVTSKIQIQTLMFTP